MQQKRVNSGQVLIGFGKARFVLSEFNKMHKLNFIQRKEFLIFVKFSLHFLPYGNEFGL